MCVYVIPLCPLAYVVRPRALRDAIDQRELKKNVVFFWSPLFVERTHSLILNRIHKNARATKQMTKKPIDFERVSLKGLGFGVWGLGHSKQAHMLTLRGPLSTLLGGPFGVLGLGLGLRVEGLG